MDSTTTNLGQIRVFSKVLSKVSHIRNRGAKQKVLQALEKNEYFQRLIHDPEDRQQFLSEAGAYMKYRFYPKGATIVDIEQQMSSFSVIVKGRAFKYIAKTPEEVKRESKSQKAYVISLYMKYMVREQLEEKFKKLLLSNNELGTKALRKRMESLATNREENFDIDSPEIVQDDFCCILEKILVDQNPMLPHNVQGIDLSLEEKLLLISKFGYSGSHLANGNLTLKKDCELRDGDSFGEAALVKSSQANYTVVAAEDLHIVSFARRDYSMLFSEEIPSIKAKMDFLTKTFPEVSRHTVAEMSYFLEEKILFHSELVYKEGEETDAIYVLRNGEIEMFTMREHHCQDENLFNEKIPGKVKNKLAADKQKIIVQIWLIYRLLNFFKVGRLPAGSIFGDEEILKKMKKRKFSVRTCQPNTLLYIIRREIFEEVFEPYLPEVVTILTDWMDLKYKWREERLQKEHRIAELKSEEKEAKIKKRNNERTVSMVVTESHEKQNLIAAEFKYENTLRASNHNFKLNTLATTANNFAMASHKDLGFNRLKKNYNEGQSEESFPKTQSASKLLSPRDQVHNNMEDVGLVKTKLFLSNLSKYKKPKLSSSGRRISTAIAASTPRKLPQNTTRLDGPSPFTLNFDKLWETSTAGSLNTLDAIAFNSARRPTTSMTRVSPSALNIRSYGLSPATPITNTLSARRQSPSLYTEDEILVTSPRNVMQRTGTPNDFSRPRTKGFTCLSSPKPQVQFRLARSETDQGVQSVNSLQSLDGRDKSHRDQTIPSLAYLNINGDELNTQDSSNIRRTPMTARDNSSSKKPLVMKTADFTKSSPRFKMSVFKTIVNRIEI